MLNLLRILSSSSANSLLKQLSPRLSINTSCSMSTRRTETHLVKLPSSNQSIHYAINKSENSSEKTLVMLPGALGSFESDFDPQLRHEWPANLAVMAWDPPGYGKSLPATRDFSPGFLERDAHSLLELMVDIEKKSEFAILGWSDGGITALLAAINYPQCVSKLVLLGTNSFFSENDINMVERTRDISKWSQRMRAPMIKMYGEERFGQMWNDCLDAYKFIRDNSDGEICRNRLGSIKCPTLVVHGDKDAMVDPQHPQILANEIPNARLERFPDGKHNLHFKYGQQFNELVANFMQEE